MEMNAFKKGWAKTFKENASLRIAVLALSVSALILSLIAINDDPVVVVTPPEFTGEFSVGANSSSPEFKVAHAISFANLMGNVTPQTAGIMSHAMSTIMSPRSYRQLREDMESEVSRIESNNLTITFNMREFDYWPEMDAVAIGGNRHTIGRGGSEEMEEIVYLIYVDVRNYAPQITDFEIRPAGDIDRLRRQLRD